MNHHGENKAMVSGVLLSCWNRLTGMLMKLFLFGNAAGIVQWIVKRVLPTPYSLLLSVCIALLFYLSELRWKLISTAAVRSIQKLTTVLAGKERHLVFWGLFLIPLLLRVVLVWVVRFNPEGDLAVYREIAEDLARDGIVSRNASYELEFPHLFWFGAFLLPSAISGTMYSLSQYYCAIALCISGCLLYSSLKCIWKKEYAYMAAAIYLYLPSSIFLPLSATHEIAFSFFLIVLMWCQVKIRKTDNHLKAVMLILSGISISAARLVNPIGMVLLIAYLIVFALDFLINRTWKTLMEWGIPLVIAVCVLTAAPYIQSRYTEGTELPISGVNFWNFYLGANEQS